MEEIIQSLQYVLRFYILNVLNCDMSVKKIL